MAPLSSEDKATLAGFFARSFGELKLHKENVQTKLVNYLAGEGEALSDLALNPDGDGWEMEWRALAAKARKQTQAEDEATPLTLDKAVITMTSAVTRLASALNESKGGLGPQVGAQETHGEDGEPRGVLERAREPGERLRRDGSAHLPTTMGHLQARS